jgi:hypothetical protein
MRTCARIHRQYVWTSRSMRTCLHNCMCVCVCFCEEQVSKRQPLQPPPPTPPTPLPISFAAVYLSDAREPWLALRARADVNDEGVESLLLSRSRDSTLLLRLSHLLLFNCLCQLPPGLAARSGAPGSA